MRVAPSPAQRGQRRRPHHHLRHGPRHRLRRSCVTATRALACAPRAAPLLAQCRLHHRSRIASDTRLPCTTARAAAPRYARADARDVYFCERKDLNYALFTIPYTYCVEILSTDGDWYYVKYAEDGNLYRALYGYCKADNLTPLDTPPENIYLNMPVTVTFKPDPQVGSLPVLGELNVTVAFYGTYY